MTKTYLHKSIKFVLFAVKGKVNTPNPSAKCLLRNDLNSTYNTITTTYFLGYSYNNFSH